MTVIKRKSISKVMIIFTIIFSTFGFSVIYHNGSGSGYSEGNGGGESEVKSIGSIEALIIQGAGYYLEGTSGIQSFLNQVEMVDITGVEPQSLKETVKCALENMNLAVDTFSQLIKKAEVTPYNLAIIDRLKWFDYDTYMKEMGLNAVVFNRLRNYLENGDITGSLKDTYTGMMELQALLVIVNNEISAGCWPEISLSRQINEKCADISLFGSYAARVFDSIN